MKGDIIIVEPHHRDAARQIVARLLPQIAAERAYVITVAGESGSGKSETGKAIAEELERNGKRAFVFQQDDYFVLPPKSNDSRRRDDISWVGTDEVRLNLLDEHIAAAHRRERRLAKPLVDYERDAIDSEVVDLRGYDVFVAEGTYTTLLTDVDCRVFIDRNRLQTLESRRRRAREPIEPFLERVLEIEHGIISSHKSMADIIITEEYEVRFVAP
ncbi:MAG: hypothetical protein EA382_07565 [Spirochaetaceae bacterium]|nr:MAG: hypothetical protein EA382_07565 [Spirochaetaceae bacterium]